MKNFKKISFVIFSNIIILCLVILISDFFIYKHYAANFYANHSKVYKINEFGYTRYFPSYIEDLEGHFNGKDNIFSGRLPDGTEYKNKAPLVIFGCSYAFGQHLNYNQTFSYKLAHLLKNLVYNRGIPGGSFQHMYMQSLSDSFYKTIPNADTVFYIMISDHYRRSMLWHFDILDLHIYPHFHKYKNQLIMDNPHNNFLNFFKSIYTVKYFNHIYADKYSKNPKNSDKITDDALLYFIETRKELEKHWKKKIKFIILFYEDWDVLYKQELTQKLKANDFIVISTKELTNKDLRSEEYNIIENNHPKEEAWNLIVPKLIERLEL